MDSRTITSAARPSPHVLREYALLADGERGILVGPRGDFSWMCLPGWDGEGVFSSLIGGAGTYVVAPRGRFVWGGHYEPAGLIWRSRWVTEDGVVESREALAYPGRADRAVVLRRILAGSGRTPVRALLDLRSGFGKGPMSDLSCDEEGVWRGRAGRVRFRWAGAPGARLEREPGGLRLAAELEPGRVHDLVLSLGWDTDPPNADAGALWAATETAWRRAVPDLSHTVAPRDAEHAVAVMTGLTGASGGMVAAATTSLPERAGEGRSYDYRYVWIRDQCYAGRAAAAAAPGRLLDDALRFLRERLLSDGPAMTAAYRTDGGPVPGEHRLDVPGYPGGAGIGGNHAGVQFQLDAFGEALLLFAEAAAKDRLGPDDWRAAEVAADAVAARWNEPDAGIWELAPRRWAHSRLVCVAGLRAIAAAAGAGRRAADWSALADRLLAETTARSTHPSGRWQRAPDDPRVDAALLTAALDGALPPDDVRSLTTLEAVRAELTEDGYVYRFHHGDRPLGEAEGAFLLCGFWMALAERQQGNRVAAFRWFERNRAATGPPALLAEEFDVRQRQLRGNLPQAFVHALLLKCAALLADGG